MTLSELTERAVETLTEWYESHRSSPDRDPERNVVCAGLAVLEAARERFPLRQEDYLTPKNQVKRTGGPSIQKILRRYGETRMYASEGGRTSRGTRPAAEGLVDAMNSLTELASVSDDDREAVVGALQAWLVDRVREYFDRQRLEVEILLDSSAPQIVADILATAEARGTAGAVAQHLVGAKLALRYPDIEVENHSYTTADQQLGRPGDFVVGDMVFHVTVAPMPAVIEKSIKNIQQGYRATLLVPEGVLHGARAMAKTMETQRQLGILSIESFVGQNIEEMGTFGKANLAPRFHALLTTYNERVAAVETDRSLLIEIPRNLL